MTDPTAVPINLFENERELIVVAPMPGVAPEDISIDVSDGGALTLRARQHGPGQERVTYLMREWSYGPYERSIDLPTRVDATRANVSFGNGVLSITFPKADVMLAAELGVERSGHARGIAVGHAGTRGGGESNPDPDSGETA